MPNLAYKYFCQTSNFSFPRGGTLNFGHAKPAIKNFHQISNFLFWGGCHFGHAKSAIKTILPDFQFFFPGMGGYIDLWSCKICHKNFLPDFQFFILGGWGTANLGHAKSAIKIFVRFPIFHSGGWGYIEL